MKNKLLIIVILSISICAKAQEKVVDVENLIPFFFKVDSIENLKVFINPKKELQYIRVVKNINLSQEQLFKRVYSYFIYNYNIVCLLHRKLKPPRRLKWQLKNQNYTPLYGQVVTN